MDKSWWWKEFVENGFQKWVKHHERTNEATTAYQSDFNDAAERLKKTLMRRETTAVQDMGTRCKDLWAEGVSTACYLRKWLLSKSSREQKTTYEIIHCKKPEPSYVKSFGSSAYVHKQKLICGGKLHPPAIPGTLVGYCRENLYRVLPDDSVAFVELQNIKVAEDADPRLHGEVNFNVVEFDLSHEGSILDEKSKDVNRYTRQSKLVRKPARKITGNSQSRNVVAAAKNSVTKPKIMEYVVLSDGQPETRLKG